ncbi:PLP-dependent aminotransferase family protein [Kribbella sandramycini]|uniref:GntR family transcriptional regulator/MocR family aminotransferase n=1 Tax=Kribbella sandramycini TaxID=60450 RepID=A0A7Y4NY79_9ACTN|nr:PLP-dependent aminotransferase family protein [Kribbella sandramycini]MBB6569940.1 GntR family transcriptional regulator/MocR family aminotransferase [Kribbella sandramycini]NOL40236.1 PLP-dependent aminotransferase family protein [Kribbella sandramycini]
MSEQSSGGLRASGLDLHLGQIGRNMRAGLMDAFREAIRTGRLAPGTRLPSSRALADDLGLGRNTVVRVYSELVNEGWLLARHGSGTEVAQRSAEQPTERVRPRPPVAAPQLMHNLRPGWPDLSSFPREEWVRSVRRTVTTAPFEAFGYADPHGHPELRDVIARYLARARGLRARAHNVVVCSGAAEGLRLVAAVLAKAGVTRVAVEEFGLQTQRETLQKAGIDAIPLPVDADGADLARLDADPTPGAVLLTPSHQFPLGFALQSDRRAAVVDWARRRGALIIEDDYDGEFRYDRSPVGALQGLDDDHVIYLGTASKSLAPGLRLGWLVVPDHLVEPTLAEKGWAEETVGFVNQLAMTDFVESGAYDRHIRAMRTQYRRRRLQLVDALARHAPSAQVVGMAAGLHIVVEHSRRSGAELVGRAAREQLTVEPLDFFRHPGATSGRDGVVIGFATPSTSAWSGALAALARALG